MFPFSEFIELDKETKISPQEVIDHLGPLLTKDRKNKIDRVLALRTFSKVVVLEDIYDRGNISAVLRSAEAHGLGQIHLINNEGAKFKESQRTTAGADKWLEIKKWTSTQQCIDQLKAEGKQIVVTHLDETSCPLDQVDFARPTALVLGNEKDGISKMMIEQADVRAVIPMRGFVQSYNISVAAALCFYHMIYFQKHSQNQNHSENQQIQNKLNKGNADLSIDEQNRLRAFYYLRSLDSGKEILMKLKNEVPVL